MSWMVFAQSKTQRLGILRVHHKKELKNILFLPMIFYTCQLILGLKIAEALHLSTSPILELYGSSSTLFICKNGNLSSGTNGPRKLRLSLLKSRARKLW
ncbi:hypothetical protein BUALT_Bualt19G0121500 [Buddleja alternifolia]|uniref:Uncharacterized protein n=1 Tax=Buddleja alternifolia TaxID=168488 RepID=A0AAV6W3E0_9LAMI|nr:hypothetical protein BUALT_Bualt19G0121500 [Buddleja alternifolia]